MADLIDRQAAIDAILHNQGVYSNNFGDDPIDKYTIAIIDNDAQTIAQLPSARPERDIPKKPISTTDRAWGIPLRQAVCPNCDVYLGMIHFISENSKTKVTYCETCGQAIDWEGWDYDE